LTRCPRRHAAGLLSDEHFIFDGTLLEVWASLKSFRRKDDRPPPDDPGNPTVTLPRGIANERHASIHQRSHAQLARKSAGREAKLWYAAHILLDNRHRLVANV
jgi:hypothetical protein